MYCIFCGAVDVAACQACGRWVCPRHRRRWLSRSVCIGCRRRLAGVAAIQATLLAAAVGLICSIVWGVSR
jgi:hypothetical protein